MNLFLAFVWLMLGVVLLGWQWFSGDARWYLKLDDLRLSYGWFMLALAVYNLARWASVRASGAARRELQFALAARRRGERWSERRGVEQAPDPTFQFTDEAASRPADKTTPEKPS